MAINIGIVTGRLAHLHECLRDLRRLQRYDWEQFRTDFQIYRSAERLLQISAECLLDIGHHIIAAEGLRQPQAYGDVVTILADEGILPKPFASSIQPIAGFRNVLVHEYLKVDLSIVYDILQNHLTDFETFAQHIVQFLEKEQT